MRVVELEILGEGKLVLLLFKAEDCGAGDTGGSCCCCYSGLRVMGPEVQ